LYGSTFFKFNSSLLLKYTVCFGDVDLSSDNFSDFTHTHTHKHTHTCSCTTLYQVKCWGELRGSSEFKRFRLF